MRQTPGTRTIGGMKGDAQAGTRWFDLALITLLLAVSIAEAVAVGDDLRVDTAGDAWHILLIAFAVVPLLLRRRFPIGVGIVSTLAFMIDRAAIHPDSISVIALPVALYSIGRHCERPRALVAGMSLTAATLGFTLYGIVIEAADLGLFNFMLFGVFLVAPLLLGMQLRVSREYLESLEERAEWLEQTREAEARRAVAEERARIARELHDVVAHEVSVMVVQTEAAQRVLHTDPSKATEAMRHVEEAGRDALTEMRRLLGVLRRDGEEALRSPQPILTQVGGLIEQMQLAGLRVELEVEGQARPLPPGLDLNAYRIVQEALTNALKHAGPDATARVTVRYEPDELQLEIVDDGRGAAQALRRTNGSGNGLVGMRERAALFGGVLDAGARPGGGYRVAARLPVSSA